MGTPWLNQTDEYLTPVVAVSIREFQDVLIVKNFIVASAVVFVYDTLLTLPSEVRFIWRSKWRPGKVLYFVTRYPVFIDMTLSIIYWMCRFQMSEKTCHRIMSADAWLFLTGTFIAEGILSLRTYALWERSLRVLAFLTILTHASFVVQIINLQHFLSIAKFAESPAPSILPCNATVHRTKLYLNFALVVIFEFVVLVMTLWKGFEQCILIFICLFAVSTTNLMLFLLANINAFYDLLVLSQRVIHSILSARVVLHLRIAADYEATAVAFMEPSDVDPMEHIHHLDLHGEVGREADNELRSTSLRNRNSSIYSGETEESILA